ncbi:MAG: SPFH domain-containing protein [Pseudomonadota bacterium]
MGLFSFFRGEFIDTIDWTDNTRDTIVWRFSRRDNAIKYGAKLTVRQGQAAVLVHEGQLADHFTPGLYRLETNNMPLLTTLQHWDHGFSSPFKSEIYFINLRRFTDLKWGTRNPVICRDPEFGPVRLRAFGSYTMRVGDPKRFMTEIVGTDGEFTTAEISFQIRNIITTHFSQIVAASGIPVLDMAANTIDLGKIVHSQIAPMVEAYGLELPVFLVENISLPSEVEAALDRRSSASLAGNLDRYTEFSAAEALAKSGDASGDGGQIGAGLGAGLGMAMAERMATTRHGPWGAPPARAAQTGMPAPPPPPAAEPRWHIAKGGVSEGPFSQLQLERMVSDSSFTRETLVWTPGSPGWTPAGQVDDLTEVFAQIPPPVPPAS